MPSTAPLLDAEDWRFTAEFTDADGQPFDLTGSLIKVVFRLQGSGQEVFACSSEADDGSLTIEAPATDGRITFVSRAADRAWRMPPNATLVSVIGDVLRRPSAAEDADTEALGRVEFTVQKSTTRW